MKGNTPCVPAEKKCVRKQKIGGFGGMCLYVKPLCKLLVVVVVCGRQTTVLIYWTWRAVAKQSVQYDHVK